MNYSPASSFQYMVFTPGIFFNVEFYPLLTFNRLSSCILSFNIVIACFLVNKYVKCAKFQ